MSVTLSYYLLEHTKHFATLDILPALPGLTFFPEPIESPAGPQPRHLLEATLACPSKPALSSGFLWWLRSIAGVLGQAFHLSCLLPYLGIQMASCL